MSRYNDKSNVTVIEKPSLSLGTIGVIVWVVFMILDYGCHVEWLNQDNPCPHFWTWFPLWAPAAFGVALFVLILIITLIIGIVAAAIDN